MGRPSKLTPEQWKELERRMMGGESAAHLSRVFGISQARISEKVTKVSEIISETAHKLADAHNALALLPVAQQYSAISLSEKLRNASNSMASAAELGAATAHRLHGIANHQAQMIDDANPDPDMLKMVAALAKTGNDSMAPAVALLGINKDGAASAFRDAPQKSRIDPAKVSTGAIEELLSARA